MSEETKHIDLLAAIKSYLKLSYSPVGEGADVIYITTADLAAQLKELYPTPNITEALIAEWMYELGFTWIDNGSHGLLFEWKLYRF